MSDMAERFPDRILSLAEVSRMAGLSRTTLWRARQNGWFPEPHTLSPGRIGWPLSVVLAWMKQPQADLRETKTKLDKVRSDGRRRRRPSRELRA